MVVNYPVFSRVADRLIDCVMRLNVALDTKQVVSRGGSRKKYWGRGAGPSSFGRQQRLSEITIEPITSASSRTTVSNTPVVQYKATYVP